MGKSPKTLQTEFIKKFLTKKQKRKLNREKEEIYKDADARLISILDEIIPKIKKARQNNDQKQILKLQGQADSAKRRLNTEAKDIWNRHVSNWIDENKNQNKKFKDVETTDLKPVVLTSLDSLVAPRTFSLRADNGRAMYSNVCTRKCSERRTFMRGGTALNLYVEPGASFRGHHWRTMLKTMYADKLPSKFDLYHARGKVDMAALVDGNMTVRGYK